MGNPSLDPETVLQLYRAVLFCMAYILGGATVIALSVYIVLVCSEMFFSQPRSKTQRAKTPQWACRVPVVEGTLALPVGETAILTASESLAKEALPVNTAPGGTQMPTIVPATLQNAPAEL
jgi:NADH:ubiquinone oxidoreductase subunit 5 (subunit L)/multisubunit Na+/H+ antiporter MnhA subunit